MIAATFLFPIYRIPGLTKIIMITHFSFWLIVQTVIHPLLQEMKISPTVVRITSQAPLQTVTFASLMMTEAVTIRVAKHSSAPLMMRQP